MLANLSTTGALVSNGLLATWTDTTSAVATVVGVVFGVPALWTAVAQLRLARQAAFSAAYATLAAYAQSWDDEDMMKARSKIYAFTSDGLLSAVKAGFAETNVDELMALMRVPNYFESLAMATDQGALPFESVAAMLAPTVIAEWQHWSPTVWFIREQRHDPSVFSEFERLATRLLQAAQSRD